MKKIILPLITIYFLSFSVILFEISLSRYFSYILTYHFIFIIIAFSLLGLSVGQIFYARKLEKVYSKLASYLVLVTISFIISVLLLIFIPRSDLFSAGSLGLIIFIIFSIIPFITIGIISGYIFQITCSGDAGKGFNSGLVYGFDLLGGASAALASYYLLNSFNLINLFGIVLIFLIAASITAGFLNQKINKIFIGVNAAAAILLAIAVLQNYDFDFKIVKNPDKDLVRLESNPYVKTKEIASRWSSFGRTDLVRFTYPDGTTSRSMFIDGAAGTEVVDISKLEKDTLKLKHTLMHFGAFFPFNFLKENEKNSVLIIGPGGGIDIAAAYFGRAKFIKAVEVNPSFVQLMRKYNPETFTSKSNIDVKVQEGRNFVRTTKSKFNIIFLTIPVTKGIRSANYLNLTEDYLFTVEALKDYLNVLTNNGRIIFTLHNEEEVFKMTSNYLALMESRGITQEEALKHIYVISDGMMPVVVIKKEPFTPAEIQPRHVLAHYLGFDRGIMFFPFVKQISIDTTLSNGETYTLTMFNQILVDVSQGKYNFHQFSENASVNFHPVYDDSPYFFNYELGLPDNLISLLIVLILTAVFTVWAFWKKWFVKFTENNKDGSYGRMFNYAALVVLLINISDILIQAFIFQKLNLNLSSPLKSFTILLFGFLLGSGIGSILTKLFKPSLKVLQITLLLVILITGVEVFLVLPSAANVTTNGLLFLIVLLPAIFISIPFPVILSYVSQFNDKNGIATLLGISGIGYFIGSIAVVIFATLWGYEVIISAAIVIYLITVLLVLFSREVKKNLSISR